MGKLKGKKLKYKGAGKGSRRRPTNEKKYRENYEKAFGKHEAKDGQTKTTA